MRSPEEQTGCVPNHLVPDVALAQTEPRSTLYLDQEGDWLGAEEIRLALLQARSDKHAVTLHCGGLTYLETSSLQVLLAGNRSMGLRFESASEALQLAVHAAGAASLFENALGSQLD